MTLSAAGTLDYGLWTATGVFVLLMLAAALRPRYSQTAVERRAAKREARAQAREQQETRRSLEVLLRQLEELSVRVNADIDRRVAELQRATCDAAAAAARLEAARRPGGAAPEAKAPTAREGPAQRNGDDTSWVSLRTPTAKERPAVLISTRTARKEPARRGSDPASADLLPAAATPRRSEGAVASALRDRPAGAEKHGPSAPFATENSATAGQTGIPPWAARVYELLASGHAPIAIADSLGLPLGEIELLLNLRRLRRSSAGT